MTVRNFVLAVLFISATFGLSAQDAAAPAGGTYRSFTPADQWELGIHAGVPFIRATWMANLASAAGFTSAKRSTTFSPSAPALVCTNQKRRHR
jgi:hypothetical protein